jgi:hypothetical protein
LKVASKAFAKVVQKAVSKVLQTAETKVVWSAVRWAVGWASLRAEQTAVSRVRQKESQTAACWVGMSEVLRADHLAERMESYWAASKAQLWADNWVV